MNQGVEIVLSRMDSHPEEFRCPIGNTWANSANTKWGWLTIALENRITQLEKYRSDMVTPTTTAILPYLSDEEVLALWDKYNAIQKESFTHRVMQTLLEEPPKQVVGGSLLATTDSISNTAWGIINNS